MTNQFRCDNLFRRLFISAVLISSFLGSPRSNAEEGAAPHIHYVFPAGGRQGTSFEITVGGQDILDTNSVRITGKGVAVKLIEVKTPPKPKIRVRSQTGDEIWDVGRISVTIAPDARPGERDIRLVTPKGVSNRFRFIVGQLPEVREVEPNTNKGEAQRLKSLPVVVNGQIMPEDKDFFRFSAKAGQNLVCRVQARSLLPYIADAVPGWLQSSLTLYDSDGKELEYVDDFRFDPDPVIIYKIAKDGEYILEIKDVIYRGREDFLYRLSIGSLPFITHIFPLGGRRESEAKIELHGVNLCSKSMKLTIPVDSPAVRDVELECKGLISNTVSFAADDVRQTEETEPNNSFDQANKVETPVIINGRIQEPGDVDYFSFHGKAKERIVADVRARRLGSPLDSIVTILNSKKWELAQNDDTVDKSKGLITHHADSHLEYTLPTEGDYTVCIKDIQGKGGEEYGYRLIIGPPRPDFDLRIVPDNPSVGQGGTAAITVYAVRKDGLKDEIALSLDDLPKGFVASFTITAPANAPMGIVPLSMSGSAVIGDKTTVREALPSENLIPDRDRTESVRPFSRHRRCRHPGD